MDKKVKFISFAILLSLSKDFVVLLIRQQEYEKNNWENERMWEREKKMPCLHLSNIIPLNTQVFDFN